MNFDDFVSDLKQQYGEFWDYHLADALWDVIWMHFASEDDKDEIMKNLEFFFKGE